MNQPLLDYDCDMSSSVLNLPVLSVVANSPMSPLASPTSPGSLPMPSSPSSPTLSAEQVIPCVRLHVHNVMQPFVPAPRLVCVETNPGPPMLFSSLSTGLFSPVLSPVSGGSFLFVWFCVCICAPSSCVFDLRHRRGHQQHHERRCHDVTVADGSRSVMRLSCILLCCLCIF